MNKLLLFAILLFCFSMNAQKLIKFTYDSAGNQTQRMICVSGCNARMAVDSIYKTEETITEKDMVEDEAYEQISYYPNPVREELYVKWQNEENKFVTDIQIFSMSGQLIKNYTNLKNTNTKSIVFQNFPVGVYNLILSYNNSERKTLKIIKK